METTLPRIEAGEREGFGVCLCWQRDCLEDLYPEEAALALGFGERRLREFRSGRHAARTALVQAGGVAVPLLRNREGVPLWPEGFTGTISHSREAVVAVCARRDLFLSVGVDLENTGRLRERLWTKVFREEEQHRLLELSGKERDLASTVFFGAKEAFFKMQFPLTGMWLGFRDVEVTWPGGGGIEVRLHHAEAERLIGVRTHAGEVWLGQGLVGVLFGLRA